LALRRTKKRQGWKTHYLRWMMALRRTKKRQGWKTHYLRCEGSKAHSKMEAGLENTLPKVVEGFKAHSKGGRVRKHTT